MKPFANPVYNLAFYLVAFVAGVMVVSLMHENNLLLTSALVVVMLLVLKFLFSKDETVLMIISGVLGPLGETIAIYFGTYQYTNPNLFLIPSWLPFLWGLAVVTLKKITENIITIKK
jgi:hypothetical protein